MNRSAQRYVANNYGLGRRLSKCEKHLSIDFTAGNLELKFVRNIQATSKSGMDFDLLSKRKQRFNAASRLGPVTNIVITCKRGQNCTKNMFGWDPN